MTSPNEKGARVRFPPPLVFLGAILLGVLIQRKGVRLSLWFAPELRIAAGVVILVCGVSLVVSARIWFKRTGQSPFPWTPTPEVIFQGPYRFTRNPMYVGVTLFVVGLGIALNDIWISVCAAPALLLVHFIAVLPEERYLTEKFGESYRSYLARVRRYI